MMKTKVCGITNSDDAMAAVESGADALGFIFVRSSQRYVSFSQAERIIGKLPASVLAVGVFVNEPRANIQRAIEYVGLNALQFHGMEPPEDVAGYKLPVLKAHRVGRDFNTAALQEYPVHAHLLDAAVDGQWGGTGTLCDWKTASRAARIARVILSGGLTPENVADAIRAVHPYAVDVSSGVERQPGIKDHRKVREFVTAAQRAFELHHVTQAE